jgi:hypothetical protein
MVVGDGLAACAGGRARRQCVLRPAHGDSQIKLLGELQGRSAMMWVQGIGEWLTV